VIATDENGRLIVESRDDIPSFADEDEERAFWDTHTLGGALLDGIGPMEDSFLPQSRPLTKPAPIRFGEDVIARTKGLLRAENQRLRDENNRLT